jgi:DNA-binding response OmpR family regulator
MTKVLVLDDDIDILQLVNLILTRNGLAVQTISRWQEIGDVIRDFAPGLILMDISLGTADGREICKSLKQDETTRHIPIILFSANIGFQKSIDECQAQGFIAKPFDLKTLVNTVNGLI